MTSRSPEWIDLVQHQVELLGALEALLLSCMQPVTQRQKLPLVHVHHIACGWYTGCHQGAAYS